MWEPITLTALEDDPTREVVEVLNVQGEYVENDIISTVDGGAYVTDADEIRLTIRFPAYMIRWFRVNRKVEVLYKSQIYTVKRVQPGRPNATLTCQLGGFE